MRRALPGASALQAPPWRRAAPDLDRAAGARRQPEELVSGLEPGDFFFIDSTHVVKAGSDVVWLYLHVLPLLPPGAIVHIHDVFWPFEYLDDWLREGREWTEIYLLHAFLMYNADWEILLFGSWLWHEHPELVPADLAASQPGSIWLRRTR